MKIHKNFTFSCPDFGTGFKLFCYITPKDKDAQSYIDNIQYNSTVLQNYKHPSPELGWLFHNHAECLLNLWQKSSCSFLQIFLYILQYNCRKYFQILHDSHVILPKPQKIAKFNQQ